MMQLAAAAALAMSFMLPVTATGQTVTQGGQQGRYIIIHSPHVQRDTVLLDTATGRTWQLQTNMATERQFWMPMARADNQQEMEEFDAVEKAAARAKQGRKGL